MLLFRGTELRKSLSPEEMQRVSEEWMAWFRRLTEQGKAVAGNPLEREGKIVSGKDRIVSDGPFAESKEAIGGYFLLDVATLDEAVAIARDPRKPLAAIFFSTSPHWTKRSPSPGNAPVSHMAYVWKSDQ